MMDAPVSYDTPLGVSALRILDSRDAGMSGEPAKQHPTAFTNIDPLEAAAIWCGSSVWSCSSQELSI